MPAIEIIAVMKDQKTAGPIAGLLGRMSGGSSKSGTPNDFLGMMQMTMAEYQTSNQQPNQSRNQNVSKNQSEEINAPGAEESGKGKNILFKGQNQSQDNEEAKKVQGNASPGETATKPADENKTEEEKENIAAPVFSAVISMDKIIAKLTAAAGDEKVADSYIAVQKSGKKGLVDLKDILLNGAADKFGKQHQHKDNLSSLVNKDLSFTEANPNAKPAITDQSFTEVNLKAKPAIIDQSLTGANPNAKPAITDRSFSEVNLKANPEVKNQLVKALADKGMTPEEIEFILKAIEDTSVKLGPPDQLLQAKKEPEMKDHLVHALAGKGIPADVVAGILKELDQTIMDKEPLAQENTKEPEQIIAKNGPELKQEQMGKFPTHVETAPSFKDAAIAILEKKGFSVEDIKDILRTVEQATVGGSKAEAKSRSEQSIFIHQPGYHKEFIEGAAVGRKKIHADIYQKEASLEDFRHEKVQSQIKTNPLEKQTINDGPQKELMGQPESKGRSEKKDVFAGVMKGAENKRTISNDKEIAPQTSGKIITATTQDDQGKWTKMSGDVSAKSGHKTHEDLNLTFDGEKGTLNTDFLRMAAKGAEFHPGKATVDTSKTIYQSVVDQIQDGFSLAQNKDNGQVRLTLKPESMGHMDMQIAVRNDTVQIMMTVENEKVHQAMNAHIDDLKSALQNQGLKIDKIEVTLQYQPDQERSFYQDQAKSQFNNPGQNSHQERMSNQQVSFGDDHYPINGQEIIQKQSITEGVSIFA